MIDYVIVVVAIVVMITAITVAAAVPTSVPFSVYKVFTGISLQFISLLLLPPQPLLPCANQKTFFRGGPTLTFFLSL